MSFFSRLLPHPLLSAVVAGVWILLVNTVTLNALAFAVLLGVAIPLITRRYWPEPARVRRPLKIVEYGLVVLWDICVANVQVAWIILTMPNSKLRPAWITIPLEITRPEAITVLAGTITMTPGTVSSDLSADGRALLVHCLHAPDPEAVRETIKQRYERRLKEIFP